METLKAANKERKMRILLIMRDPPDTAVSKGGLFPTAIRHHVDLGFDVYVASISKMTRYNKEIVRSLGAKPAIPPATWSSLLSGLNLRPRQGAKRPKGPNLLSENSVSWIAKEIRPEVVTGIQSFQTGIIAQKIAQFIGVEYVTWEHVSTYGRGASLPVSDETFIEFLRNAHAVLSVSSSLNEAISQRFSISLSNSSVLPNPVPSNFTQRPQSPVPDWLKDIPSRDFVFASWTTWRDIKRLDLLLEAFAKVHRQRPDVKMIVAGPFKEKSAEIMSGFLRRHPDITESVIVTGRIDRAAIRHLAEAADCCVISSDTETFGLPMVEALSVGTPVVSTRCGGPEDVLTDSRLGELCDKDNPDALSTAMLRVMGTYATYQPAEISRIADGLFGDVAIKKKWAAVYSNVLPGTGSKS